MLHKGRVALVTGAARGIGFAIARKLVNEGAQVALLDRDGDAVADAAKRIGNGAISIVADLAQLDGESAASIVADVVGSLGRLDILVNNAGVIHLDDFISFPTEKYDWVMNVNVRAPMLLAQAAAKQMIGSTNGGAIVNLSSIASELAGPGATAYAASKAAIKQMTKVMALELIRQGVRVNAVGPGTIKTDMSTNNVLVDDGTRTILARTPAGRLGEPEEIAAAVSWLASSEASYIVGQTVYVDGGRTILNYTMPVED